MCWVGSCCCSGFSLVAGHGLLTAVPSLVKHSVQGIMQASAVVALRLSCPTACGIFLDQGWNLCLLNWQVDSLPLSHQGSPRCVSFYSKNTAFPPFPFFHLHHPMYENISPFWCPLSSPEAIYLKNIPLIHKYFVVPFLWFMLLTAQKFSW